MNQEKIFPATSMPDNDWWHELWPDPNQVLKDIGLCKGMMIVDLCCGDGYFTKPMCELADPGIVFAVDLDANLLSEAEKTCSTCKNFRPINADARDLAQLTKGPVDMVMIANTFHGVPEQLEMSRNVFQVLKDDGRFVIINWYKKPREETTIFNQPRGPNTELRMQPEDVQRVVEPAGFQLDTVLDVGPYHYAAIFKKSLK